MKYYLEINSTNIGRIVEDNEEALEQRAQLLALLLPLPMAGMVLHPLTQATGITIDLHSSNHSFLETYKVWGVAAILTLFLEDMPAILKAEAHAILEHDKAEAAQKEVPTTCKENIVEGPWPKS